MATYLLLINNQVIQDEAGNNVLQVRSSQGIFYTTAKTKADATDLVMRRESQIIGAEMSDPFYPAVAGMEVQEKVIDDLKIVLRYTPLYILKQELVMNDDYTSIKGLDFDVRREFNKHAVDFYIEECGKFGVIMEWLENVAFKNRVKVNSPLAIKKDGKQVMNLLWVQSSNLFNPITLFKDTKNSRLFRNCFNDFSEVEQNFNLDMPDSFRTKILGGNVEAVFVTSTDALKMCNIDFPVELTSRNLYYLIAGVCIRNVFPELTSKNPYVLSIPCGAKTYGVANIDEAKYVAECDTFEEAFDLAEELGPNYVAQVIERDLSFIKRGIPKYEKALVDTNNPFYQLLGGAHLVQEN